MTHSIIKASAVLQNGHKDLPLEINSLFLSLRDTPKMKLPKTMSHHQNMNECLET